MKSKNEKKKKNLTQKVKIKIKKITNKSYQSINQSFVNKNKMDKIYQNDEKSVKSDRKII